jgi:bifunctional N-acetylglucosamine-1-phosphate-uridyltransferase/glucosamine-1-phosphate-acetyltransferase GlmU-like protein
VTRLLVIPAAGRGTRLGWNGPKLLYPVSGKPMIDYLFERYAPLIDRVVIVVAPDAVKLVRGHLTVRGWDAECVVQTEPAGMLPAILCSGPTVERYQPRQIWITWCDQIAISAGTAQRLARELDDDPTAALVFPTVRQQPPYIHFAREADGRISHVLQRREGDTMPAVGESDAGLFALAVETYRHALAEYDRLAGAGRRTNERNFLPFIPWLAARAVVRTFNVPNPREAIGVNSPDDVRTLETYLRGRRS